METKLLLTEIHDLLDFLVRQARRHDLDEVRIATPRAKALTRQIRELQQQLTKATR
jgi:hypothetical protein